MTPAMSPERAKEIAAGFDLRALPPDFYANPYPVYELLRETEPVKRMPDGSYFLTRYADLVSVYRDAQAFSSDKKVEFTPKYGAGSALLDITRPAWSSTIHLCTRACASSSWAR